MAENPGSVAPGPQVVNSGAASRVLWLIAVLAIVLLWLEHQLGMGLAKLGWVAGALTFWGVLSKVAAWLQQKKIIENVATTFGNATASVVGAAAAPGPLVLVSVIAGILIATLSSVTVIGEGSRATLSLEALEGTHAIRRDSIPSGGALARFRWVWTSPFGQLYRVEASGYMPATVTVYPFVGRHVALGSDLSPSPSLLFRPFVRGVGALRDGAILRVMRIGPSGPEEIARDSGVAAFRLGRAQPVTERMRDFWDLDLSAAGTPQAERARLLKIWNTPRELMVQGALSPRDRLIVEVVLNNVVVAREEVAVTGERLTDVLIQDVRQ